MRSAHPSRPAAIAMWDFSWLERRWPGAGYENWDTALDELVERGYDAVRIDAFPHLVAAGSHRRWELLPVWNQQMWGSPARTVVQVQPDLGRFVSACAERGVSVALSSWFRRDVADIRMLIATPEDLGRVWVRALDSLAADGLLDSILYVDLCNEFAGHTWAPFFSPDASDDDRILWNTPRGHHWLTTSIDTVRAAYPTLDYCFSFISGFDRDADVSSFDLLDLHVFMPLWSNFDEQVGYIYDGFDPTGYDNLVRNGERLYRQRPEHWQRALRTGIATAADWARHAGKPLVTTECWGVVNYKDWPLLDWGWVKELCEYGVARVAVVPGQSALTADRIGPRRTTAPVGSPWLSWRMDGSTMTASMALSSTQSLLRDRIETCSGRGSVLRRSVSAVIPQRFSERANLGMRTLQVSCDYLCEVASTHRRAASRRGIDAAVRPARLVVRNGSSQSDIA